jgi:hypothetical protein
MTLCAFPPVDSNSTVAIAANILVVVNILSNMCMYASPKDERKQSMVVSTAIQIERIPDLDLVDCASNSKELMRLWERSQPCQAGCQRLFVAVLPYWTALRTRRMQCAVQSADTLCHGADGRYVAATQSDGLRARIGATPPRAFIGCAAANHAA